MSDYWLQELQEHWYCWLYTTCYAGSGHNTYKYFSVQ